MGYYLEGDKGFQVDGITFKLWVPGDPIASETKTEEAKPISRKCANCKSWFLPLPNDQEHYLDYFGALVRICDYCAKEGNFEGYIHEGNN
jgi:hypothetical protein